MAGFPWPLDGAQAWFEELWNWVSTSAYGAVQGLWDWVISRFHEMVAEIRGKGDWLWAQLEPINVWIGDRLVEVRDWLWARVEPLIIWLRDQVKGDWEWLWSKVEPIKFWIYDRLGEVRDWLFAKIEPLIIWLRDQVKGGWEWVVGTLLPEMSSLWTNIDARFGGVFDDLIWWIANARDILHGRVDLLWEQTHGDVEGLKEWADALLHGALSGVAELLGKGLQGFFDWVLKHLTHISAMIMGAVHAVVNAISDITYSTVVWFTDTITSGFTAGSPPKEIERATKVLAETSFHRQLKLIDGLYKSPASPEDAIGSAQELMGLMIGAGAVSMSLAIAADQIHPFKNIGWRPTVREIIYWTGIPSVTAAIAVLPASIGLLAPLRYALYERWQPLIPAAPDLIRFAVREVFIPEEMARLIVPGPGADFYKYLATQGYSEFWANAFWASHWVRPTVTQLNNALYREIINIDEWRHEVRLNDVAPYSIPWLEQIIFSPYTRVDIRRMWDMRTVDESEVYKNYRWLGYDDEHAKGMVLWTKVYTAFPDLIARFRNGWITAEDVLGELVEYGMPESRAIELLQTKIAVVQPERVERERDLTKTDILKLLGIGEISDNQAKELLMGLGYDDLEATYLIAIQLDRMVEEVKELTSSLILKSYRYKIFDRMKADLELIAAGWSPRAAEVMLKLEDVRREDAQVERVRQRDLSRTDIIKSIRAEIIGKDTGFDYLAYLGYSEWEINVIFALEMI